MCENSVKKEWHLTFGWHSSLKCLFYFTFVQHPLVYPICRRTLLAWPSLAQAAPSSYICMYSCAVHYLLLSFTAVFCVFFIQLGSHSQCNLEAVVRCARPPLQHSATTLWKLACGVGAFELFHWMCVLSVCSCTFCYYYFSLIISRFFVQLAYVAFRKLYDLERGAHTYQYISMYIRIYE